jgi:hypothetical protein
VAAARELRAQLTEVVDLTGMDHDDLPWTGGGRHRLAAAIDVDDRQPALPERDVRSEPGPGPVRTPVRHGGHHRVQDILASTAW